MPCTNCARFDDRPIAISLAHAVSQSVRARRLPPRRTHRVCRNWSVKSCPPFCWSTRQELSRRRGLPHATIIIAIRTTNGVIQRRPGGGSPSPGGAAALHLSCRRDTLGQDLPHCPHDYDPCARGKDSRHVILRHHANAARASIALGTLPQVVQLCFPGMRLKEHRQDGYFALPNGSRVWIGGLDDNVRVEKILGLEYASVFLNEASQFLIQPR